jgi:hypothetical protein
MQFFTWKPLFRNNILVSRCLFLYMYDYNGRGFVIHIYKEICGPHKYCTYIYLEYHSVCPLVRNGTPTLSSASECAPPEPKGGGGGPNSEDWRKGLALFLRCGGPYMTVYRCLSSSLSWRCFSCFLILSIAGHSIPCCSLPYTFKSTLTPEFYLLRDSLTRLILLYSL